MRLIDYMRSGANVRRYHTVPLIREETVGHHSANVAMLCWYLSDGDKPSSNLLLAALTHDLVEQHTGDVPSTAKWASDRLCEALKELEDDFDEIVHLDLSVEEKRILKQADMLDLCYKCMDEYKMGNTLILPMLQRGLAFLEAHNPLHTTSVLMEELYNELS